MGTEIWKQKEVFMRLQKIYKMMECSHETIGLVSIKVQTDI